MEPTTTQKKTQNDLVLEYLQKFGSITSLQAFEDLGITRISARIFDLREAGHHIMSENVKVPRRNGETTTVSKYRLVTKKQTELAL